MSATILYNAAKKQVSQLDRDLAQMGAATDQNPPPHGLMNQVAATLSSLDKTSRDLSDIARNEITAMQREKASSWAESVKADLSRIRVLYEDVKRSESDRKARVDRAFLLNGANNNMQQRRTSGYPMQGGQGQVQGQGPSSSYTPSSILTMDHMLKERSSLQGSRQAVSEYVDISRNALQDLYEQREYLKGSHKRILDVANSLGLSTTVIKFIEKRTSGDKIILFAAIAGALILMYLIVKYLG